MPDILVCRPDFFEVAYTINPYMAPEDWNQHKLDYQQRAKNEWSRFIHALQKLNVDLHYLPPAPGVPDMVFTANGGLVLDKKILLSRFRYSQRQCEEPYFLTMFESLKKIGVIHEIIPFPQDIFFEGCGDALWDYHRKVLWFGYGQRSEIKAADIISEIFDVEVVPLQLISPVFYHLDTCFCPLTSRDIMYYPNAFSKDSVNIIEKRVEKNKIIKPYEWSDITKLSMNAICIENNILFSRCSSDLECRLYDKGYHVVKSTLDTFLKSGGGPACLHLSLSNVSH